MDPADCLYCRLFARPPSQTEIADLAKTAFKKYFSSLIKFWAHMEADNQSLRNSAYAMLDFSSFEAEDPGPAATNLVLTIFAYRNPLGKWDAKVKTLETQAAGISQKIPKSMLKQLGL